MREIELPTCGSRIYMLTAAYI